MKKIAYYNDRKLIKTHILGGETWSEDNWIEVELLAEKDNTNIGNFTPSTYSSYLVKLKDGRIIETTNIYKA